MTSIPKLRWVITALLLFATMLNYIDRLTLSVVITDVRKEFSLSEQDYSQIVSLFLLAYAIMYAGSGYIVDRLGTRRGFAVFMFGWSVAQMLHSLARGKWSLAGCRFLLGWMEPGNFPAAVKAVAEWFPSGRRSIGVGIFNAGSSLGSAIAAPLTAFFTIRYGWRSAFLVTGALGLFWLACWLMIYQPPLRNRWISRKELGRLQSELEPAELPKTEAKNNSWFRLLQTRQCYTLILARFLTDPVIYFIMFWLPEYLRKERGFSLEMVGAFVWIPFLFGDIGYVAGGWFSSYLIGRGWTISSARKTTMLIGAALLPSAIWAPLAPTAPLAIAAICLVTLGHAIWIANLLTLPTDLFPGTRVGTVTGFSGMGGAVGGIFANLLTGYVVARVSYLPVFAVAGLMHPLSALLVHRLIPAKYFEHAKVAGGLG
jgi:MFS transporter, ACS family, aldohexuronate transporter